MKVSENNVQNPSDYSANLDEIRDWINKNSGVVNVFNHFDTQCNKLKCDPEKPQKKEVKPEGKKLCSVKVTTPDGKVKEFKLPCGQVGGLEKDETESLSKDGKKDEKKPEKKAEVKKDEKKETPEGKNVRNEIELTHITECGKGCLF